jgi:hypothetical protein
LRYDSLESYFADSAEEWTANPCNRLRDKDGAVIATAGNGLTLDFLGAEYPGGDEARRDDVIESTRDDYGKQYLDLRREHPEFRNVAYGRAIDTPKGTWLQYWFFYFLNDYQLSWGFGVHEGDWEMVQFRLGTDGREPEIAVYAQHSFSEVRPWSDVRRLADEKAAAGIEPESGDRDRPLVYAGRGSHASYFTPGYHPTDFYDVTDGKRHPRADARLEVLSESPSDWAAWPGHWGGKAAGGEGPTAPCTHEQWRDPEKLIAKAYAGERRAPEPDEPHLWARRRRNRLLLEFDFSPMAEPPKRLVATVNSVDEPDVAPHTLRFALREVSLGTLQTRVELDAHKHYDVSVAVVDTQDRPTGAQIFLFAPSAGLLGLRRRLTAAFGRLVHLLRLAFGGS